MPDLKDCIKGVSLARKEQLIKKLEGIIITDDHCNKIKQTPPQYLDSIIDTIKLEAKGAKARQNKINTNAKSEINRQKKAAYELQKVQDKQKQNSIVEQKRIYNLAQKSKNLTKNAHKILSNKKNLNKLTKQMTNNYNMTQKQTANEFEAARQKKINNARINIESTGIIDASGTIVRNKRINYLTPLPIVPATGGKRRTRRRHRSRKH